MSYTTMNGEHRTSVTVRLSDTDLQLLDELRRRLDPPSGAWRTSRGAALKHAIRASSGLEYATEADNAMRAHAEHVKQRTQRAAFNRAARQTT